jgi:probable F420-dependent oxidoreductase
MKIGVIMGGPLFAAERLHHLPGLAREAEAAGIDVLTLPDHVVMGQSTENYPYGNFPFNPTQPYAEPLTVLAAAAAVTSTIELLPSTLIVPLRPAVLLAKACATLDLLSEGRFVLGAGTGWHVDEFNAAGVPFAERGRRMDDTLRACRVLWRDSPASFSSPTVSFDGIHCEPRPLRPDSIRIWVGGSNIELTARRVADYADGWLPPPTLTTEQIRDGVARLREARAELTVSYTLPLPDTDLEGTLEAKVPALAAAGVTYLQIPAGRFASSVEEVPPFLERLAGAFAAYR